MIENVPHNVDKTPKEFVNMLWESFSYIENNDLRHQAMSQAVICACDELERCSMYATAAGFPALATVFIERLNELALAAIDLSYDLLEDNETFSDIQNSNFNN